MTQPKGCRCRKRLYPSANAANEQLAGVREKAKAGNSRRRERASYECPDGKGWHLTSKSRSPVRPLDTIASGGLHPTLHPNALDD